MERDPREQAGARVFGRLEARVLAENWWMFLVRGLLAIVFGVLTFVRPIAALTALVFVFGVWAFIDGINALALSLSGWRSWQMFVGGLVGIAFGVFTFVRPGLSAVALFAAIAAWAIARGILEIVVAIELRKAIEGEFWLVLAGALSILFGVLMIALPVAGVLAIAWILGVYALTFGALLIGLSLRLRQVQHRPRIGAPQPA